MDARAAHPWFTVHRRASPRAPGFITLLARELGCSTFLDESSTARSSTCGDPRPRDPKLIDLEKSGLRRGISITWRDP